MIIGVHTPEFAFEHARLSNVEAAVKRLGIMHPVVQDNDYKTWDNYANQYWPAEYLIDKNGHVRHMDFGEGQYPETEQLIRTLLGSQEGAELAKKLPDLDAHRVDDTRDLPRPRPDRELRRLSPEGEWRRRPTPTPLTPLAENLLRLRRTAGTWGAAAGHRRRAGRIASAALSSLEGRVHRARRQGHRGNLDQRQADREAQRELVPALLTSTFVEHGRRLLCCS